MTTASASAAAVEEIEKHGTWKVLKNAKVQRKKPGSNDATLFVGISYYNQKKCLERCLQSLEYHDRLIPHVVGLVDGRYKGFNSPSPLSTDGSRELVEQFAAKYPFRVSRYDAPDLHEREKRQRVVDLATLVRADFLLILDCDEWVECEDWRALWDELSAIKVTAYIGNIYGVRMLDYFDDGKTLEQDSFRPRLWFRPEEIKYLDNHWKFARVKDSYISSPAALGIQGKLKAPLILRHCHDCNAKDREEQRKTYETDVLPTLESPR